MRPRQQPAFEAVTPGVIGTDELAGVARLVNQSGAPVSTNVVQGADGVVFIAYQDHGLAGNLYRQHVSLAGNFVSETGKNPVVVKQDCLLQLIKIVAGITKVG